MAQFTATQASSLLLAQMPLSSCPSHRCSLTTRSAAWTTVQWPCKRCQTCLLTKIMSATSTLETLSSRTSLASLTKRQVSWAWQRAPALVRVCSLSVLELLVRNRSPFLSQIPLRLQAQVLNQPQSLSPPHQSRSLHQTLTLLHLMQTFCGCGL